MYDKYFEVFLADTSEARDIHYRVRYQVYCLETGYENPLDFPTRREMDSYDAQSVHFIVRARTTGEWIAAMRLILGPLNQLPISQFAALDVDRLFRVTGANKRSDFSRCAEVSRLSVVSQFRRRSQEKNTPFQIPWKIDDHIGGHPNGSDSQRERRRAPWLMLGLIRAARDYCEEREIRYWFFLIANSLARIIKGLGMELQLTGPECDHRGKRSPWVATMPEGFDKLGLKSPEMFARLRGAARYRRYSELNHTQPAESIAV